MRGTGGRRAPAHPVPHPKCREAATARDESSPTAPPPQPHTLPALPARAALRYNPLLSTLRKGLDASQLKERLADPELVATILAPTNSAFTKFLAKLELSEQQLFDDKALLCTVGVGEQGRGRVARATQGCVEMSRPELFGDKDLLSTVGVGPDWGMGA